MNVNNENKLQELSLYVNINLNNMNIQKQQNAKTYNKDNNSLNNINKIKRKVNIMNYNQRELQNRISDIQVQEAKIDEMEKTLQNAKNIYSENIKNEKKESSNIKVKIKQLAKKEDELNFMDSYNLYNERKYFVNEIKKVILDIPIDLRIQLESPKLYYLNNLKKDNTKNLFIVHTLYHIL